MSVEIQEKEDGFQATDYFNSRIEGDVACFAKPIQSPEEHCARTITETKPKPAPSPPPATSCVAEAAPEATDEAPAPVATTSASVRMMLSQTFMLAMAALAL